MFRGIFAHTIDKKGRTSLPVRFREALAGAPISRLILTAHFDPCLHVYTLGDWEAFEKTVTTRSLQEKGVEEISRFYVGGAHELDVDRMGRILVPSPLREHARLEKDIVWVGRTRIIELWSKDGWEAARLAAASGERREHIAKVFAELGGLPPKVS